MKTSLLRPSMGVARSVLCAPGEHIALLREYFVLARAVLRKMSQTRAVLFHLELFLHLVLRLKRFN